MERARLALRSERRACSAVESPVLPDPEGLGCDRDLPRRRAAPSTARSSPSWCSIPIPSGGVPHEPPPPLEQIRAPVRGLDLVPSARKQDGGREGRRTWPCEGGRPMTGIRVVITVAILSLWGCVDQPTYPAIDDPAPVAGENARHATAGSGASLTDREILVKIAEAMSIRGGNWLTELPLWQWKGVATDSTGRVTDLILYWRQWIPGFDVGSGLLPAEIGQLSELRVLKVGSVLGIPAELADARKLRTLWVYLAGADLPAELGTLEHLDTLTVYGARGQSIALPPDIAAMPSLRYLKVQNLASIPPEIGYATNLRILDLKSDWGTSFGPIPEEIGQLRQLDSLYIRGMSGSIPAGIGWLERLSNLHLEGDSIAGPLPPEMQYMAGLRRLRIKSPRAEGLFFSDFLTRLHGLERLELSQVGGRIPESVGDMKGLRLLVLVGNITGELPTSLGQATNLGVIIAAGGNLSGTIPEELGNLKRLWNLTLAGNADLHGPLPESITRLPDFHEIDVSGTGVCLPGQYWSWLQTLNRRRLITRCSGLPGADFYLVQRVQSLESTAPLVAGEDAMLRVFYTSRTARPSDMLPGARLDLYHGGGPVGSVVAEPGGRGIRRNLYGDDMGDLDNSVNAMVPGHLIVPGLEVELTIDPRGRTDLARLGIPKRIDRQPVWVEDMKPLHLTLVPVIRVDHPDSSLIALVDSIATDPQHRLLRGIRSTLPISQLVVASSDPVTVTSAEGWAQLPYVSMAREARGGTGYWMGITRSTGGLAALGGGYVSVSSPDTWTMAHELGHSLGLYHAPCGRPDWVDSSFRAGNDEWGIDPETQVMIHVGSGHDRAPDLMSYCHRNQEPKKWISVYHFNKAVQYRKWVHEAQAEQGGRVVIVDPIRFPRN